MMLGDTTTRRRLLAQHKDQINKLEVRRPWRSVFLYVKVYAAITVALYLGAKAMNPLFTLFTIVYIAGRQHSLYILNHDASHGNLFKSRRVNRWVATVFSNLVMYHHPEAWSYIQWRRIHMKHHGHLFTKNDPNYVTRQEAGDGGLGDSSYKLTKTCLLAIPQTLRQLFQGKHDYVAPMNAKFYRAHLTHIRSLISPFPKDHEMEVERRTKLVFFLMTLMAIGLFDFWRPFLLLWLLPMYTIYPLILKFHDLTEHYWTEKSTDPGINARSVRVNFLSKITISFLPRGLHREHHLFPKVCVADLPTLAGVVGSSLNY